MNKNNRVYSKEALKNAMDKYIKEKGSIPITIRGARNLEPFVDPRLRIGSVKDINLENCTANIETTIAIDNLVKNGIRFAPRAIQQSDGDIKIISIDLVEDR